METSKSISLKMVLTAFVVLYLLFSGVAVWVTLTDGGNLGTGLRSGISWMWMPAVLFLILSILSIRALNNNPGVIKLRKKISK